MVHLAPRLHTLLYAGLYAASNVQIGCNLLRRLVLPQTPGSDMIYTQWRCPRYERRSVCLNTHENGPVPTVNASLNKS